MTESQVNGKKVSILQYINTFILSFISVWAVIIFTTLNGVKTSQSKTGEEMVRMKTVQDINVNAVKDLDTRVTTLELNYLDYIKNWVDQNYVRKPQR